MKTPHAMTPEELHEMAKTAKVNFAESPMIDHYDAQVNQILLSIAKHMIEEDDDPQEWANSVFVSDMSQFSDFGLNDGEMCFVSLDLGGIPVNRGDYIYAVAAKMAGVN
jgi:hypothetical protein